MREWGKEKMSRHDYNDELEQQDLAMWRGRVMSAIRGKRGQRLLIDLRDALDAMPEKRLVRGEVQGTEGVCALGSVGVRRGVDLSDVFTKGDDEDPDFDNAVLSERLDIAECLVREIEWENDEGVYQETPEQRWTRMRRWAEKNIASSPQDGGNG